MSLQGDLCLVGGSLLVRHLTSAACDARLELSRGPVSLDLDFVAGALQCLPPRSLGRRSGSISGRTLTQLLERGAALRGAPTEPQFPLRDLLSRRGLSPDERRAAVRELLAEALTWPEGKFRLDWRGPAPRLRRAIEGEKTLTLSGGELLRALAERRPELGAPDRPRTLAGSGRGLALFLDLARERGLAGTLMLQAGEGEGLPLLVVGGTPRAPAPPPPERLEALAAWGRLRFEFRPGRPGGTPPAEVGRALAELAAQTTSWAELSELVAGPAAVFRFTSVAAEQESARVFGLDGLVAAIDGRRSVNDLCGLGGASALEVVRTLADLITLGYVQRVL